MEKHLVLKKLNIFLIVSHTKTRFTLLLSGLYFLFLILVPYMCLANEPNSLEKAKKKAEKGDYEKAYMELLDYIKELEFELNNKEGLLEYYKDREKELSGEGFKKVDHEYNAAANRLWVSAWRLQHDGIFKKSGHEKEETLLKAIDMFKRIVIDYPYADKAEEAQYRTGRIYFKYVKDYKKATAELEKYLRSYPRGKFASDARGMLNRIAKK